MTRDTVQASSAKQSVLPPDAWRLAVWGVILLAVCLRLYLLRAARATEEDFYITLRYAENLASGRGWVYNPGEAVLGTTTPLYTMLLALFACLHLDPTMGGKLSGILADGLSCWCMARLGRTLGRPLTGMAAALCLAIAPVNLTEATKGMEAGLVAAAGIAAWTAWAERKEALAWIAAALLVLLRIDGVMLACLLLAATLLRSAAIQAIGVRDRVPWRGLMIFVVLTLPWLLFAAWRFGSPVPASLRAKLVVYAWHNLHHPARFPNLRPFLSQMTHNPFHAFLFVGACLTLLQLTVLFWSALQSLYRKWKSDSLPQPEYTAVDESAGVGLEVPWGRFTAPFLWMLLYYGGMAFSKVFLFGWYYVPPTPVYYLSAMLGWSWVILETRKRVKVTWKPEAFNLKAVSALMVLGGVLSLLIVPRVLASLKKAQQEEEERLRIPIGLWLRDHAKPQDTVMLEPIGYIGYLSRLRVLDTVGLVSPEVLPFYTPQILSPYHELWRRFQPEWVLLRAGEWNSGKSDSLQGYEARLPASERLESRYRLVQTFPMGQKGASAKPDFYLFQRIER